MRLYLIRHGKAQRQSPSGLDQDRELTERGRQQALWLGRSLAGHEQPPGILLTSPAARARQTAALVGDGLALVPAVREELGLGACPSAVVALLAALDTHDAAALVGHNPTLSGVVAVLCRGPAGASGLELRTGQAAVVDLPDAAEPIARGTLIGLLRSEC